MSRRLLWVMIVVLLIPVAALAQDYEYSGRLNDNNRFDEYPLTLTRGETIVAFAEATSGDLDTVLLLIAPNGEVVAENDDRGYNTLDSAIGYTVERSGSYTVRIERYADAGNSGRYELTITVGDESLLETLDQSTRVELSGPKLTRDTEHFRIHYTLEGEDATTEGFVDALALSVEEIWRLQIDRMGWPPPPSDGMRGGNERYDVYLADLVGEGEHALGYTVPETITGDNPETPHIVENGATSYIILENDFDLDVRDYPAIISLMRTTMSHEFNHAIQFGYEADDMHWYYEATATWMETAALIKDEDATGYVEYVFKYPELCFGSEEDVTGGMGVYGSWLFLQALSDRHGSEAVRLLWENIASYQGFEALEHTLEFYGDNLESMVAQYHVQNLIREYDLAPNFYATVWLEESIDDVGRWTFRGEGIQELAANYFQLDLTPGVYYAGLTNDDGLLDLWAVGVRGVEADAIPLGRGGTIDTSDYDYYYLMVFNPVYDDNVNRCEYYDYQLDVTVGKGATNPVARILDAVNFEPLD